MNIFQKARYKTKEVLLNFLLDSSLRLNNPSFTAWALRMTASKCGPERDYKVLCLGRTIFLDDVGAMARYSGKIRYIIIHRRHWKRIFDHCFAGEGKGVIEETNYHLPDFCELGKRRYRGFLVRLLPALRRYLGFNAFLSGNFGYLEQQELAAASVQLNIPFIVLLKEGLAISNSDKSFSEICKEYRFIGDRMLVYSERIKKSLVESGLSGLNSGKIGVVGVPRMDSYFVDKMADTSRRRVVFFSFYPSDKFFFLINESLTEDKVRLQEAAQRTENFHLWVMNFAARHPEYQVTIKTKSAQLFLSYAKDILRRHYPQGLENLTVTNSTDPVKLIKESSCVLGFYSTTIVEAVAAGKTIVAPYFRDLITSEGWDYFAAYPNLIKYVRNEKELETAITEKSSPAARDSKVRMDFLQGLLYNPDGRASERTERELIKVIMDKKG